LRKKPVVAVDLGLRLLRVALACTCFRVAHASSAAITALLSLSALVAEGELS